MPIYLFIYLHPWNVLSFFCNWVKAFMIHLFVLLLDDCLWDTLLPCASCISDGNRQASPRHIEPNMLNLWKGLLTDILFYLLYGFCLSSKECHRRCPIFSSSPAETTQAAPLQSHGWATRGESPGAWALYLKRTLHLDIVWHGTKRPRILALVVVRNKTQERIPQLIRTSGGQNVL